MDIALLITRLLLAVVFAVAGLAKLADPGGSRRALADFGVPAALAGPLGILLPLAELAVAAALVPSALAWWGALGALALLTLFVAGIGINLARGRAPDCHCFGQLHSAPAGPSTLARNAIFAAIAAFVVWRGPNAAGPNLVGELGGLATAELAGLIGGLIVVLLVAAEGWILLQLLRQNGRLLVRLEALEARLARGESHDHGTAEAPEPLPVGSPAPEFALPDLDGRERRLRDFLGRPLLVIFFSPQCGFCQQMAPQLGQLPADGPRVLLISRGDPEEHRRMAAEHEWRCDVVLQREWEVHDAYRANGTPTGYLLDAEGRLASSLAIGADELLRLASSVPSTGGSNGHENSLTAEPLRRNA
jgi:methylamine dehydrogenase accessory protein MauD